MGTENKTGETVLWCMYVPCNALTRRMLRASLWRADTRYANRYICNRWHWLIDLCFMIETSLPMTHSIISWKFIDLSCYSLAACALIFAIKVSASTHFLVCVTSNLLPVWSQFVCKMYILTSISNVTLRLPVKFHKKMIVSYHPSLMIWFILSMKVYFSKPFKEK